MRERKRGEPANETIARELGTRIATGDLVPGEMVPKEVDLATRFAVSRSVIREGIRMLVAKGLVESRPKAGTRVRQRADWNLLDPELLGWMFSGAPPLDFVRSLFELRLIIEPAAAALAARKRTAGQLGRMGHALEEMARFGLAAEEGRAADQLFHAVLLEATQNELMVSLSASIAAAVRWTTFLKYRGNRRPRDPLPEHRALYEAIVDADEAAARDATVALVRQAGLDTEAALLREAGRAAPRPAAPPAD